MLPNPPPAENDVRKRKTHKKSRKGCGNCKLRRVKCDEQQPQCQKCLAYGVTCNYNSATSSGADLAQGELHLPGEGSFTFYTQPAANEPTPPSQLPKDSLSPEGEDYSFDGLLGATRTLHETAQGYVVTAEDLDLLVFFREKTVYSIGTAQMVHLYRWHICRMLNCEHTSYLFHIVLALVLMHKRHLDARNPWQTQAEEKETYHWYHGTALFNTILNSPIADQDRDPLWSAAALLGCITIASISATRAEEAWPLKPPSVEDLDWLRMSDGKKEVWRIVDPLREGSVWREALDYNAHKDPEPYNHPVPELDLLYPWLIKIYDFDPNSTENAKDPYYTAASILTRLMELDCNHSTIMYFLSFIGHMDPKFRDLLHRKDPKALLLLAWWYGKMCQYNVWWQSRRMVLEGQAICLYLERTCEADDDVLKLLVYPRMMTGLMK